MERDESLLFLSVIFCTCFAWGSRLARGQRLHLKAKPRRVELGSASKGVSEPTQHPPPGSHEHELGGMK